MAYIVTIGQLVDFINTHKASANDALTDAEIWANLCLEPTGDDEIDDTNEQAYENTVDEYIKEQELTNEARHILAKNIA